MDLYGYDHLNCVIVFIPQTNQSFAEKHTSKLEINDIGHKVRVFDLTVHYLPDDQFAALPMETV